jgi:outer membrane protein W
MTAWWVNLAPSPVSGNRPNSDSTSSTVHVTDSRHCAGKAAYDYMLAVDTHINFSIEDYRKELEWKISVSVA